MLLGLAKSISQAFPLSQGIQPRFWSTMSASLSAESIPIKEYPELSKATINHCTSRSSSSGARIARIDGGYGWVYDVCGSGYQHHQSAREKPEESLLMSPSRQRGSAYPSPQFTSIIYQITRFMIFRRVQGSNSYSQGQSMTWRQLSRFTDSSDTSPYRSEYCFLSPLR
jgi:hypothetical protein